VNPNCKVTGEQAVIRVYDTAGNVIETHEHKGEFRAVLEEISGGHPSK